ncbi:MAG: polysaccharide export outer membrane protein [Bacteroidia bacterium]|jgi:polysaccharide export outer membrane protein
MLSSRSLSRNGVVPTSIGAAVALLFLLLASGCSMNSYPPIPESQKNIEVDYDFILGPGDVVKIFVWGNEELSTGGAIRPDGKITTELVEDLQASGKTTTELARDIEDAYSEYVRDPVVSVIAGSFMGIPDQSIRVMGEATKPSRIPYRKDMTLLDLMIIVGGLTEYADGNNSVLVRTVDGKRMTYSLRLDDLVRNADISADVVLMPGDILIIAEAWF